MDESSAAPDPGDYDPAEGSHVEHGVVEHPTADDFGHARVLPEDRTWFKHAVFYDSPLRDGGYDIRDFYRAARVRHSRRFRRPARRGAPPGRVLLAEANQWPADVVEYFGDPTTGGDECHMAFHFPLMPRIFMAVRRESRFPQPIELNLQHYNGYTPVEMTGYVEFPRVGRLPYLLTLPGHGFYWFQLRAPSPESEEH